MADCRMIAVYCKTQTLAELVKQIQEPLNQIFSVIDTQQQILEANKENLVKNQLSKPEIATMLKHFETAETSLMNMQAKLNDARQLTQFLERNLILHYQFV